LARRPTATSGLDPEDSLRLAFLWRHSTTIFAKGTDERCAAARNNIMILGRVNLVRPGPAQNAALEDHAN
jgi:hypothetical protein